MLGDDFGEYLLCHGMNPQNVLANRHLAFRLLQFPWSSQGFLYKIVSHVGCGFNLPVFPPGGWHGLGLIGSPIATAIRTVLQVVGSVGPFPDSHW
jgi:hypothetical protein